MITVFPIGRHNKEAVEIMLDTDTSLQQLKDRVRAAIGAASDTQDFVLTDFNFDFRDDDSLKAFAGNTLHALFAKENQGLLPTKERIDFSPHPKTLTMAGDYEYFAAQGHHPFAYALAELIDNALRATRIVSRPGQTRTITISFVTRGPANALKGLICVQDNGSGMTKQALNDWAIMNLSMEDRGQQPVEPEPAARGQPAVTAAGSFLTGELSYFGVGSKNAAFFMGQSIKVTTKKADSPYVHELALVAAELEQRYKESKSVYEEDLVHRLPGDASTLSPTEGMFPAAHDWVAGELQQTPAQAADRVADSQQLQAAPSDHSFTRVVIADLKPEVLQQIADSDKYEQVCRDLAHLYHYYLHGEYGNIMFDSNVDETAAAKPPQKGKRGKRKTPSPDGSPGRPKKKSSTLPTGQAVPDIVIQHNKEGDTAWEARLADVNDDTESLYLRAQQAQLQFTLSVPDHGTVSGVLWYFPFQNDMETLPLGHHSMLQAAGPGGHMTQLTQAGAAHMTQLTQRPAGAQFPFAGSQSEGGAAARAFIQASCPMFEAFWQGRLIPGARIDSLPFVQAVRTKRSAASKDTLPDEVFHRIRGALFFGPGFKVTRNKLLFRDNLQELLAAAVPGDRNQERNFREWLTKCHSQLDKSLRFMQLADAAVQEKVRAQLGAQVTAFDSVEDGQQTLHSGDVLRLATKPVVVGRALHFVVGQVVQQGGVYANGQVVVQPLPAAIYGDTTERTVPLRRLEAVLTEEELQEHSNKEMQKAPSTLTIEPAKLAPGNTQTLLAGEVIAESKVAVSNAAGQLRLVKAYLGGQKTPLTIVQRLWRLKEGQEMEELQPSAEASAMGNEGDRQEVRKGKKGKKKGRVAAVIEGESISSTSSRTTFVMDPSKGELVLEVSNRCPNHEVFEFGSIQEGMQTSGTYVLQYELQPSLPGQPPLASCTKVTVLAGPPVTLELQGEGRAAIASKDLMLGEHLPPLTLLCKDCHGNGVPMAEVPAGLTLALKAAAPQGQSAEIAWEASEIDVDVSADVIVEEGTVKLKHVRLLGRPDSVNGLAIFPPFSTPGSPSAQQQVATPKRDLPTADLLLCVYLPELPPEQLSLRVRPGAPQHMRLRPDHPWSPQVEEEDEDRAAASPPPFAPAKLSSGDVVPTFWVQAVDRWGNSTGPTQDLPCNVVLSCDGLHTSPVTAAFDDAGIAKIKGLTAGKASTEKQTLEMALQLLPSNPLAEAACEAAGTLRSLELPLHVQPSTAPASITFLLGEHELPVVAESSDGSPMVILESVPAGSILSELGFYCRDEANQPVHTNMRGKVQLSWSRGSKGVVLEPGVICLPDIAVAESIAEPMACWIRFLGNETTAPTVELAIQIQVVAAAPVAWGMAIVAGASQPTPRDQGEVQCGQPFRLEIVAHDKYGHRCSGLAEGGKTAPIIEPLSKHPLHFCRDEWHMAWQTQAHEDVYVVKMSISGQPSSIKLVVRDEEGPDGTSALNPDSMDLALKAGPSRRLVVESPVSFECATRAVLPQLKVRVADVAGNYTDEGSYEVALNPSALAADDSGHAASVQATGGNKVKLQKGAAAFKDVKVTAEEAGEYVLRVASSNRKVALDEAELKLTMSAANFITDVAIDPDSLPDDALQAGSSFPIIIKVQTEDGQPLTLEGTGKASSDENNPINTQGNAMACVLAFEVQASDHEYEGDVPPGWRCEVLFCDDSTRFASVNQLTERHSELAAKRQHLQGQLDSATRELTSAQQIATHAGKAADARRREAGPSATANLQDAQARLAEVRQGAEAGPSNAGPAAGVEARFGPPNQASTLAIQTCLQTGDPEAVGVLAQLATVDDTALSQVLAAQYRGLLPVLVVQTGACTQRMNQVLQQAHLPLPDILSLSHSQPYKGQIRGETPGQQSCSERAASLLAAACQDSDDLLPLPLPHTRALTQKRPRGSGGGNLAPQDWPQGCLGYAFNLVRPTKPGHRASLLYSLLGNVLLFETLADASAYRELVTQKLESGMADIVTLDGRRITSKGITSGSNFRVPPLAEAPCCFGSAGQAMAAQPQDLQKQEAVLEGLIDALQQHQEAQEVLEAAQQAADEAEAGYGGELQQVEQQMAALDEELAKQGGTQAPARHDGKKGGRRRARSHVQAISHGEEEEPPAKRASVDGQHDTVKPAEQAEDVPQAQAAAAKKGKRRRLEKIQA
ncbi:hypothetical protein WJX82_007626 [Trebouxia sp. C0006]